MGSRVVFVIVALAVLSAAGPALAAGPWEELRRPMDLPELEPGQACPVSQVDQSVDWESTGIFGASGTGPGPVYAGLGGSQPSGDLWVEPQRGMPGWLGGKLFWYAAPSYRDRALIRGRRLDARGPMRFAERRGSTRGLRVERRSDISWKGQPEGSRGRPSGGIVRSSGCYGVQVDGTSFSRTIVFTVTP